MSKRILDMSVDEFFDYLEDCYNHDGKYKGKEDCPFYDRLKNKNEVIPPFIVIGSVLMLASKDKIEKLGNQFVNDLYVKDSRIYQRIVEETSDEVKSIEKARVNAKQVIQSPNTEDYSRAKVVAYLLVAGACNIGGGDVSQSPSSLKDYIGMMKDFSKEIKNKFEEEAKTHGATVNTAIYKAIIPSIAQDKQEKCEKVADLLFKDTIVGGENMGELTYESYEEYISSAIKNGAKQIILTGAPGTGKTRMAKEIAKEGAVLPWTAKEATYELVQFHPSYDYTDFIEGLRPVENADGKVEFRKLDGIFKRFCRHVAEQNKTDKKYFFLIDEINRADLSKVFGELMYCLESDKRGEENKIQTQYQNLTQYYTEREIKGYCKAKEKVYKKENLSEYIKEREDVFADGFYIPENVIIIGTMNDIDRSVESMDYALRRRFLWKEIEVSKELLKGAFENFWSECKAADEIAERVMALNKVLVMKKYSNFGMNRQYYISQGQFANLPKDITDKLKNVSEDNIAEDSVLKGFLEEVFQWRIEPLLREYVRGEDEETVREFISDCKKELKISDSQNNTGAESDSKTSGT